MALGIVVADDSDAFLAAPCCDVLSQPSPGIEVVAAVTAGAAGA